MSARRQQLTKDDAMYECVICYSFNHVFRAHCQHCGTVPSRYSWNGKPVNDVGTEAVRAIGAVTVGSFPASRIKLQTIAADYYAEKE